MVCPHASGGLRTSTEAARGGELFPRRPVISRFPGDSAEDLRRSRRAQVAYRHDVTYSFYSFDFESLWPEPVVGFPRRRRSASESVSRPTNPVDIRRAHRDDEAVDPHLSQALTA